MRRQKVRELKNIRILISRHNCMQSKNSKIIQKCDDRWFENLQKSLQTKSGPNASYVSSARERQLLCELCDFPYQLCCSLL